MVSVATKKKVYVAKGIKYFSTLGVAEFEMEAQTLKKEMRSLLRGLPREH